MSGEVVEVPVTARIPQADKDRLEELAARSDRSRSAEVRRAIREYLEREMGETA